MFSCNAPGEANECSRDQVHGMAERALGRHGDNLERMYQYIMIMTLFLRQFHAIGRGEDERAKRVNQVRFVMYEPNMSSLSYATRQVQDFIFRPLHVSITYAYKNNAQI